MAEGTFFGTPMKNTPFFERNIGQNFVPTDLKVDADTGQYIVPDSDEPPFTVRLPQPSEQLKHNNPDYIVNWTPLLPILNSLATRTMTAAFEQAKGVTGKAGVIPDLPKLNYQRTNKQDIRDRLQASKNKLTGLKKPVWLGVFLL